jgi:hypothetical protein
MRLMASLYGPRRSITIDHRMRTLTSRQSVRSRMPTIVRLRAQKVVSSKPEHSELLKPSRPRNSNTYPPMSKGQWILMMLGQNYNLCRKRD